MNTAEALLNKYVVIHNKENAINSLKSQLLNTAKSGHVATTINLDSIFPLSLQDLKDFTQENGIVFREYTRNKCILNWSYHQEDGFGRKLLEYAKLSQKELNTVLNKLAKKMEEKLRENATYKHTVRLDLTEIVNKPVTDFRANQIVHFIEQEGFEVKPTDWKGYKTYPIFVTFKY